MLISHAAQLRSGSFQNDPVVTLTAYRASAAGAAVANFLAEKIRALLGREGQQAPDLVPQRQVSFFLERFEFAIS
jgi:hypothetical protein